MEWLPTGDVEEVKRIHLDVVVGPEMCATTTDYWSEQPKTKPQEEKEEESVTTFVSEYIKLKCSWATFKKY